jgi:hypothetical protein
MDRPVPDEPTTRVDRAATNGALIAVGSPISEKALATRAVANCPIGYGPHAPAQQQSTAPWATSSPYRKSPAEDRRAGVAVDDRDAFFAVLPAGPLLCGIPL